MAFFQDNLGKPSALGLL